MAVQAGAHPMPGGENHELGASSPRYLMKG
jgi:hypothetical protein